MASGGGYSSDANVRKSARRKHGVPVLTFNYHEGEHEIHDTRSTSKIEDEKAAGKYKVVAAESLDQCYFTRAEDLSGSVVVEFRQVIGNACRCL